MGEKGCLKDGNFQNLQVEDILTISPVTIESASDADAELTIKSTNSSGGSAELHLTGDANNDLGDSWKISAAGTGKFSIGSNTTTSGAYDPVMAMSGDSVEANRTTSVYGKLTTSGDLASIGSTTVSGQLFARGYAATKPSILYKMPAHASPLKGTTTLTIANLLTGMLVTDPDTTVTNWTFPTASLAVAGVDGCAIGDCLDFSIVNAGTTTTDEIISVVAGSGCTIYGSLVTENDAVSGEMNSGSSSWRLRFITVVDTKTYAIYRIS